MSIKWVSGTFLLGNFNPLISGPRSTIPNRVESCLISTMARLLELPDELLDLIILKNLLAQPEVAQKQPDIAWAETLTYAAKLTIWHIDSLYRLILTCRRFHNLLQDFLYRQMNSIRSSYQLTKFAHLLGSSPNLKQTTSATIFCLSISELAPVFWIPSITNVQLIGSKGWKTSEASDITHHPTRKSPVDTIYLVNCGFSYEAFGEILRWPKLLKSLSYEVNQDEYMSHYRGLGRVFSCTRILRSLFIQRKALENLAFTRAKQGSRWACSRPINLSKFTALKTLSIFLVFLSHDDNVYRRLPHSLEELQVYYDDTERTGFLRHTPNWLFVLLQEKRASLPNLRKVSIFTPEAPFVEDEDNGRSIPYELPAGEAMAIPGWEPPADLEWEVSQSQSTFHYIPGFLLSNVSHISRVYERSILIFNLL